MSGFETTFHQPETSETKNDKNAENGNTQENSSSHQQYHPQTAYYCAQPQAIPPRFIHTGMMSIPRNPTEARVYGGDWVQMSHDSFNPIPIPRGQMRPRTPTGNVAQAAQPQDFVIPTANYYLPLQLN